MALYLIDSIDLPEELEHRTTEVESCHHCGNIYLSGWFCPIAHDE